MCTKYASIKVGGIDSQGTGLEKCPQLKVNRRKGTIANQVKKRNQQWKKKNGNALEPKMKSSIIFVLKVFLKYHLLRSILEIFG